MEEELQLVFEDASDRMKKGISHLEITLMKIRAGKADPNLLNDIMVDYYGNMVPLSQVSNINTPDSRTISIQPWERNMIGPIEKAIMQSNIGLNPMNNGETIRLNLPPLTEERRRDLAKQVKNEAENARVTMRNIRRDANEEFKRMKKDGLSEDLAKDAEARVQNMTDKYIKLVDEIIDQKEKDIMTI